MGINCDQECIEIEVFIRRATDAKATVHKEELPFASGASSKDFHYVHPSTVNLSEANKVVLGNLV